MKGRTLKILISASLVMLFVLSSNAQRSRIPVYGTSGENTTCGSYLSAYRTFFKLELYKDAFPTWLIAFNQCPSASKRLYLDGVTMYRSFIEETPDGPAREGMIDTLMLIYDRRMENFGDEGNVLGRKGRDLLTYRGDDIEQVMAAYNMLEKSIEIQGRRSKESVLLLAIRAGIALNDEGKIDDTQLIEDYIVAIGILIQQEKRSTRWEKTKAKIDELILKEGILFCDALDDYFEPQFEENKNDKNFLEQIITVYNTSGCESAEINVAASENLYLLKPGPESARNLAMLFITRQEYEKAAVYLKEAVQGDNIDRETRAEWFYELAVLSHANGDFCQVIDYAREAIMLKSDLGKAYVVLGDAIISSRENLGDNYGQRTAFWAAADMYQKAFDLDPDLADVAKQKLDDSRAQFPNNEDVFFRDLKNGDSYLVEGCINAYTKVRSRK